MAEFLNKEKLLEWIPRIIETSEKELIIVSPYIQVSDKIISLLKKAEKRSVEITLIYKEGELSKKEREKFDEIENLNLLFHSNLHSKCLYNEKYLLLTSMNLYEYSQKHNREMGVLFRRTDDEANGWNDYKNGKDDDSIFQDAIEEIRSILSSSDFEKESFKTKTNKFDISIIKSDKDFAFDRCDLLNKFSKNKKFIVFQDGEE
jgi:phosphatidylserine/phosphatidylglycerophosphate/cardiolipin synthase-like enzyme